MSDATVTTGDRPTPSASPRGIAARVRADTPLRGVGTVLARELRSFFATPTAWTILALATLLVGALLLLLVLRPGEPATLRPVMSAAAWILILLAPAVSMRALSEELRFGTWEVLLSTPVTSGGVVVGKFLACLVVLVVLGAPLLVAGGVLELHGRPDWGEIACGLLGLLLAGGAFVAFGILASALTSSQLVAYLLSLFFWLSIALAGRLLPPVLPVDVADAVLALDPTRRLEDFVIGLFDTGNVVAFVALTIAFLVAATVSLERRRSSASRGARARATRTAIGLIGTAVAALAVAALAQLPQFRASFDLTRTRAYSLAEPTRDLLRSLDGDWSITLLAIESENDPAIMRQVDEVLERMREVRTDLRTDRIDPLDASSVGAFEDLLDRLRAAYATEVAEHEAAIDDAVRAQAELADFALDELPRLRSAIASMAADDPQARELFGLAQLLAQQTNDGERFDAFVREGLRADGARPLPDYEGVRAALAANHEYWSGQAGAAAQLLGQRASDPSSAAVLRTYALGSIARWEAIAVRLRAAQEALTGLEPLGLADAGAAIQTGEAAIVIGPPGAAVVPSWQIFPRTARATGDARTVSVDRRFRGEDVLASSIRSLLVPVMPAVVFVHAEERSVLRGVEDGRDLFAMADALRAARFDVREWIVPDAEAPVLPPDRIAVFVVVPPMVRNSVEPDARERALLDAANALVREERPIVLSLARSLLPSIGRDDPWAALAGEIGVDADTERSVTELAVRADGSRELRPFQSVRVDDDPDAPAHPLRTALLDRAVMIFQPIPLAADPAIATPIVRIAPGESRWLEEDARRTAADILDVPESKRFPKPLPVVLAIDRGTVNAGGPDARPRRALVVGSAAWLLSTVADLATSLGGDRRVLASPGNRELLLSAVAWLAGLDDLIATSGSGREVSRLAGLGSGVRITWSIVLLVVLPGAALAAGLAIGAWRRRG